MKRIKLLAGLLLSLGCAQAPASSGNDNAIAPLKPIEALDLPRYLGTWYEIARYPNWFQKKCAGNTTATYSMLESGHVEVVNRCTLSSGEQNEARAEAVQQGEKTSARLKVRFAPKWLSFVPGVWGDYWVIDLDTNYQLAAVSEPSRQYLWILARTPTVEPKAYADLLERLQALGFATDKLISTNVAPATQGPLQ